ncbi:lipopolysaccharide assembly protein LapA domain-containing protein [Luteimonas sp. RIT-PG2_3]
MRLIRILIAVVFVVLGVLIGSLNEQRVRLDLGWIVVPGSLGVLVLAALSIGVIVGGLMVALSTVLPLHRRLKQSRAALPPPPSPSPLDDGA